MKKSLLTLGLLGLSLGAFAQTTPLTGPWVPVNQANIQTPPSLGIAQIFTLSPTFCWALSYDGATANSPRNTILTPSNATGTEFNYNSVAGSANLQAANISAISTTLAYCAQFLAASPSNGEVIRTTNGGGTWRKITANANFAAPAGFANWVHMFNANEGIAMGDPNPLPATGPGVFEIIRTTNASASATNPVAGATVPTWTRLTAGLPAPLDANEYGIAGAYEALGNNLWFGTDHNDGAGNSLPSRIFRSTDRGITWAAANTPLSGQIPRLAFKDALNGIACHTTTTASELIRTTDGGATWALVPLPAGRDTLNGKFYGTDIQSIPGQGFISVGRALPSGNLISNFGVSFSPDGLRWYDMEKGVRQYISAGLINCATAPNSYTIQGYLGGFTARANADPNFPAGGQRGMYQIPATTCARLPLSTVRSATLQSALSVYPNPSSNGVFQVSLNDGIKAGTLLTVFDVMGRVVMSRELNATAIGSKSVNLDLSNEQSGVYTLRVSGASGFATSKLVVE